MHKLSRHIAIRMTAILTVVAIVIGGIVLYNNTNRIENLFKAQLVSAGKLYSEILEKEFGEISHILSLGGSTAEKGLFTMSKNEDLQDSVEMMLSRSILINNVFFVPSEANEVHEGFVAEKITGNKVMFNVLEGIDLYAEACHELYKTTPSIYASGEWAVLCDDDYAVYAYFEPLVSESRLIGYIGTVIDISRIKLPTLDFLGPSSGAMLLDEDGHILTSTLSIKSKSVKEILVPNEEVRDYKEIENELSLEGKQFLNARFDGQNQLIGVSKFDEGIYLAVNVSERAMRHQMTQSALIYALASITYFLIVLIVSFWLMDREMKPFSILIDFVKRIQHGTYTESMPNEYRDIKHEIGDIARAVESMRISLADVFETLEDEKDKHELTQRELGVMTEILKNSSEGVLILDGNRNIVYSNDAYSKISGYSNDELKDKHVSMFDVEGKDYRVEILELLDEHGIWTGEMNQLRKTGAPYPASLIIRLLRSADDHPQYYFVITEDITLRNKNAREIHDLMNKDSKTGLPNASQLRIDIGDLIDMGHKFGLVYVGIDDFKSINEIYGFNAGDAVIVSLSEKLPLIAHETDKFYRIGGDEFAFIIDLDDHVEGIDKFIQQIQGIIRRPIRRNNMAIYLTASMGISSYPRDANSPEAIVTAALSALNKAKSDARGFHYYYSKELREQSERRQMILSQLYEAVERGEFSLMYQPKIDVTKDELIGMEALLRWDNKVLGVVSPGEFVPVAEDSAIIEKIGRWVIKQAIEDLSRLHSMGHKNLRISVNLSGQQFRDESLFAWILENLSELELDPERFELEITESLLLENLHEAVPQLNMLKKAGVVISIDDFGTGYSSLSYLQHLPIDVLKIDKSFLKGVELDSPGTIINAIIELGKALNLKVVAEGIETEAQKQFLVTRGCIIHQGYLYDKPLELGTLMNRYNLNE